MPITITGVVERVTYFNPENGYSVLKLKPDERFPDATARDGTITVVGSLPELGPNESVELSGEWTEHPRYGKQFQAAHVRPIVPSTTDGIQQYLVSLPVKGLGPRTAEKIVNHFGAETLNVLNRDPERLMDVPGIKPHIARELAEAWRANAASRSALIYLQGLGVGPRIARRIYDEYGPTTIESVKKDPYVLAESVQGIGFLRADAIARSMGLAADAPQRIRAGISYALEQAARDGHTFLPRPQLLERSTELLRLAATEDMREQIDAIAERQIMGGRLVSEHMSYRGEPVEAIYAERMWRSEQGAAERLQAMHAAQSKVMQALRDTDWSAYLAALAEKNAVALTEQQQSAVQAALTSKISVLTGGPGTGKTTTLRMVISALIQEKLRFKLASPTGRAAKRLAEATEQDAQTIHRMLGFDPGEGFLFNEDDPLEVDFIVVDEASMLDLWLFDHLLAAMPPSAHLLLVGDVDQLPSVGAGNVLRDVIDSGLAHVTRLSVIFRQSEDSHIIVNAHRINEGQPPFMDNRATDFFFFAPPSSEDIAVWSADMIVDIVTQRLPQKFGLHPVHDVQVIAPQYRGAVGVNTLNERLQAALNPEGRYASIKIGERVYRKEDKVMQTRNNYEKDVFNGDIGYVHAIDSKEGTLIVRFDQQLVEYSREEAEELLLAYCITTHRSQGSEYPVVVMPVVMQHYMMLQRNLLYTAITRARGRVVLVGDRQAVRHAVRNDKVKQRFSGLLPRLTGGMI